MSERLPLSRRVVEAAADALLRFRFIPWRYGDSIGFEGLLAAGELLDDPRHASWAHGAIRAWAGGREQFHELDNTAPGHALCIIYEATGDDALIEAAVRLADFLRARPRVHDAFVSWQVAPLRPPRGGEPLSAAEAALLASPGPGVFVDCVHFDPPFFAHLGRLLGDIPLVDEAVRQALAYASLLQDDDGLYWHFWLDKAERPFGPGWGRGQGWALLGLLDVLDNLPGSQPGRDELARSFQRLAAGLAVHQTAGGGWRSIVDDPLAPEETSTAAFAAVGFARGVRAGLLTDEFAERALAAWRSVLARIGADGVLANVSAAVWPSTVPSHYRHVVDGGAVPWGQGPLLLAAKHIGALTDEVIA